MEHSSDNFNTNILRRKILRTEGYKSNPNNIYHWKYKTICDRYLIAYVVCAILSMYDVGLNNSFVINNALIPFVMVVSSLLLFFAVVVTIPIVLVALFAWINAEL
jgi:hypothetical protein